MSCKEENKTNQACELADERLDCVSGGEKFSDVGDDSAFAHDYKINVDAFKCNNENVTRGQFESCYASDKACPNASPGATACSICRHFGLN